MVTLVHGTFARHADWIQDEQRLPEALHLEDGGTDLDRFCWSGKNRYLHRLEAGDDLRKHLVALIRSYQDAGAKADHHVVAHSHGGNVALYALRNRGDDDDALLADVKVITLATPFLFMRERRLPRKLMAVLLGYFIVALMFAASPTGVISIAVICLAVWCLLSILAFPVSMLLYSRGRSSPPLGDLFRGRATLRESDRITVNVLDMERLFVIRGLGDEASGSLAAAQLINWIMTRLVGLFGNWLALLLWALVILVVGYAVGNLTGVSAALVDKAGMGFASVVLFGPLIALPLIAGFVALSNFPFGLDSLFWVYYAQSTAEPAPRGESRVLIVGTRQFHYDKLSHGVYEDVEAIEAVVNDVAPWSYAGTA